jgi:hypothetical protein
VLAQHVPVAQYSLHPGASGFQLHHPCGSIAIAVVAIAIPTPKVSNAVANLIIIRVSSLRETRVAKPIWLSIDLPQCSHAASAAPANQGSNLRRFYGF